MSMKTEVAKTRPKILRGIKVNIRLFGRDETLRAYADVSFRVKFGEITIRRFKVLWDESHCKYWVAFPQIQYYQNLSIKYHSLLNINKKVETYITNQIMKAFLNATKKKLR